jgi:hypothetical protein
LHFVIRSPLPLRRTSGSRPRHGPRAARRPISYIYVYIYSDPYVDGPRSRRRRARGLIGAVQRLHSIYNIVYTCITSRISAISNSCPYIQTRRRETRPIGRDREYRVHSDSPRALYSTRKLKWSESPVASTRDSRVAAPRHARSSQHPGAAVGG